MTYQTSFTHAEFAAKKKPTRREKFLARMEEVIPWKQLLAVIEPHYPKGERGRPPIGLERMLRGCFLQQCSNGMAWRTKPSKPRAMTVRRYNNLPALI